MPITRVHDATPLDRLGVPVWMAVTPLARDLTVHAGKGATTEAAQVSATMEAIERVSAESIAPARTHRQSYRKLRAGGGLRVLAPERFDLPFETLYDPDRSLRWVEADDLLGGGPAWVPADLAITPAQEGIGTGVETNGLAAGNTRTEAILHALYELIERDALAHVRFRRRHGNVPSRRRLDPASLSGIAGSLVTRLRAAGMELILEELTHDIGVPVYSALLLDASFPGREGESVAFQGLGADLDAMNALVRALTEAAQSHTALLLGARETFESVTAARPSIDRVIAGLTAGWTAVEPPDRAGEPPPELGARLAAVLERLRSCGFRHALVVDLTREDLRVPVVRVLVPGAAAPYGESRRRPSLRLLRALL